MLSTSALRFLREIAEAAHTPVLRTLSGVVLLLVETAELATQNRKSCRTLCEQIFELVLAVSHELNNAAGDLPDELLLCLDELQEKLVRIQLFIREHLRHKSIAQFVNSSRNAEALAAYRQDVRRSLEVFRLQAQVLMHKAINDEQSRKEDWVAAFPPEIEVIALRLHSTSSSPQSPGSAAPPPYSQIVDQCRAEKLPHRPYIFFGRSEELRAMVDCVLSSPTPARIAVLGAGGIGKSALAVNVLHDPAVAQAFACRRFFVACDAADSAKLLLSVLASSFGITSETPRTMQGQLLRRLSMTKCLLVLDNFESPWEDVDCRADVEALLATLAGLPNLTLILTLRGIERPSGVDWSRPFLPPLEPLQANAARQTFLAIANVSDDDPHLDQLIEIVERLPLGVTLMSNLAQYETTSSLLTRWNEEQTSMLQRGGARRHSSLDVSIRLSLDGPRIRSTHDAVQMLYVLSMLPDGLERCTILELTRGLSQPARCLSALLQTSLAYRDTGTSIRVLSPIRSYVLSCLSACASPALLVPVYEHYTSLAQLGAQLGTAATRDCIAACVPEIGNMESVLTQALSDAPSGMQARAAKAATYLVSISRFTCLGNPAPILQLSLDAMRAAGNKEVLADCMLALATLGAGTPDKGLSIEQLVAGANELYREAGSIEGQIDCMKRNWSVVSQPDTTRMCQALSMAEGISDVLRQGQCHLELGQHFQNTGPLDKARMHFSRAKDLLEDVDEHYLRARCTFSLGHIASGSGYFSVAMQHYRDALDLMVSIDSKGGASHCYSYMGWVCRRLGDASSAIVHTRQAVEGFEQVEFVMDLVLALVQLVQSHVDVSDVEAASQTLASALLALGKASPKWIYGQAQVAFARGDVSFLKGDVELAELSYSQAITLFWQRNCTQELAELHLRVAHLRLTCDDPGTARAHAVTGIALARRGKHPGELAACVNALAEVMLAAGEETAAFAITRAVLPTLNGLGKMRDIANCFERFAKLALVAGDAVRTQSFCADALQLYETCVDRAGMGRCQTLLQSL